MGGRVGGLPCAEIHTRGNAIPEGALPSRRLSSKGPPPPACSTITSPPSSPTKPPTAANPLDTAPLHALSIPEGAGRNSGHPLIYLSQAMVDQALSPTFAFSFAFSALFVFFIQTPFLNIFFPPCHAFFQNAQSYSSPDTAEDTWRRYQAPRTMIFPKPRAWPLTEGGG